MTQNQNEKEQIEQTDQSKNGDEKAQENEQEDEEVTLHSAKILLAAAQKEYEYEIDRKKTLETRSGVLIAFSGVVITLATKIIDSNFFNNVAPDQFIPRAVIFGFFFLIPILLLLFAVVCFIRVILVKKYSRLDVSVFNKEVSLVPELEMSYYLMERYRDIVMENKPINTKNSVNFLCGALAIGIASLLIITLYIIAQV